MLMVQCKLCDKSFTKSDRKTIIQAFRQHSLKVHRKPFAAEELDAIVQQVPGNVHIDGRKKKKKIKRTAVLAGSEPKKRIVARRSNNEVDLLRSKCNTLKSMLLMLLSEDMKI